MSVITSHSLYATRQSDNGTLLQRLRDMGVVYAGDVNYGQRVGVRHYDNLLDLSKIDSDKVTEYLDEKVKRFVGANGVDPSDEAKHRMLLFGLHETYGGDGVCYNLNHFEDDFPAFAMVGLFPDEVFIYKQVTEMDLDGISYVNSKGPCNKDGVNVGAVICTVPSDCIEHLGDGTSRVTLAGKHDVGDLTFSIPSSNIIDANIGGLHERMEGYFKVHLDAGCDIDTVFDVESEGVVHHTTPRALSSTHKTRFTDYPLDGHSAGLPRKEHESSRESDVVENQDGMGLDIGKDEYSA